MGLVYSSIQDEMTVRGRCGHLVSNRQMQLIVVGLRKKTGTGNFVYVRHTSSITCHNYRQNDKWCLISANFLRLILVYTGKTTRTLHCKILVRQFQEKDSDTYLLRLIGSPSGMACREKLQFFHCNRLWVLAWFLPRRAPYHTALPPTAPPLPC